MEKLIFPMDVVNISQLSYGDFSHQGYEAIDITGKDKNIDSAFAPCTVKVLKKYNYTGQGSSANTVLFGSCDSKGNEAKVLCADGIARVLTLALTHDDDISDIKEGQIFKQFEKFYDEGSTGVSAGNHIHLEISEGWIYQKSLKRYEPRDSYYPNFAFTLDGNLLMPEKMFFLLTGRHVIGEPHGLKGENMPYVDNSNTDLDTYPDAPTVGLSGFAFRDHYLSFDIPKGPKMIDIYVGGKFNIIDLYKWKASDDYRWGWASFNGKQGYLKYDPSKIFLFGKPKKTLHMVLEKSPAWLREFPLGKKIKLVDINKRILVLEIPYKISSDGYRWCKGLYNGTVGYFQYDPDVMYPTTEY